MASVLIRTKLLQIQEAENVKAVQRFIGLTIYLSRFMPHLSETCEPLRRLTDKGALWSWQLQHEEVVVKRLVSRQPILKYYNVHEEVTIQRDASEDWVGATLLQNGQPVAYASRAIENRGMLRTNRKGVPCHRFCLVRDSTIMYMVKTILPCSLYQRKKVVHCRYPVARYSGYHGQHPSKLAEEIAQIQHTEWVRKITDSRLNQIRDDEQERQSPVIENSDSLWMAWY